MSTEKITFDDLIRKSRPFGEILFIRMLMQKQKELGIKDITDVAPDPEGKGNLNIVLTANGVQLPFIEVLNGLREALGDLDAEQVDEWVQNKVGFLEEYISDLKRKLKLILTHELDDKFPDSPNRNNRGY